MKTQISERVHIGIFGNTNSGKSTLLNYMTQTDTSIVSEIAGTTTDPIRKTMEITGFGPVLFIDTAGFMDKTDLGSIRHQKSREQIDKCDIFLYCLSEEMNNSLLDLLKSKNKPIIYLAMRDDLGQAKDLIEKYKALDPISVNIKDTTDRDRIFGRIKDLFKREELSLTKSLVKEGDSILLVMPQDKAAPKGRLIKPQVTTIREIIDKNASAICTNLENLDRTLANFKKIDLVICDSQVFGPVYQKIGGQIPLTSFSVLFSAFKGDLDYFVESAKVLDNNPKRILISEECTHPPIEEDIGRVKIPNLLKKKFPDLEIDFVRVDEKKNYEDYDLIISCGACMINRTAMLSKVARAKDLNIPMTNYGITIAKLKGILDKIKLPE